MWSGCEPGGGNADRCTSTFSSDLARSISYLISWDTSLAASATRSPNDWSAPAGSGVLLWTIESISLMCGPLSALEPILGARVRLLSGLATVQPVLSARMALNGLGCGVAIT